MKGGDRMEVAIKGFPNYTITNDGRVFSLNYCNMKGNKRELLPSRRPDGYLNICLCKNNKKYTRFLHRLVAEHFIPNPDNLPQVNHKDGDKSNCNDWNLEWCTQSHNIKHAYDNGLMSVEDKRRHLLEISKKSSSITSKPVLQLYNDGTVKAEYKNAEEASVMTGANRRHICSCCNGKRKTCGGWKWKYKEV